MIVIVLLVVLILILCTFLTLSLRGKFGGNRKNQQVIFDEMYAWEEVESLEVLSSTGDVDFKESLDDKVRVVVYGENANDLSVDLVAGRLKVDNSKYKHKMINFGFHFYVDDIVIYLPKGYAKNIDIKANYGDIEIFDLENASVNIEEECGDVVLESVKNAVVRNHYGDIEIGKIGNKVVIESDCGDVKIHALNLGENSSIENNFGDIKIDQTNEIYIEAKTDLGNVKVNQNNRHSEIVLKIENNCGDIKVEN